MPTARNLAGDIAKLLRKHESEGRVYTLRFQEKGWFPKGRGAVAPAATSGEAVALMLAMASGLEPKAAVGGAMCFFCLPVEHVREYRLEHDGEKWSPFPDEIKAASFGESLAYVVNLFRAGLIPPDQLMIQAVRIGSEWNTAFGEIVSGKLPNDGSGADRVIVWRYSRGFDSVVETGHALRNSTTIPGAILNDIARLLGPLFASSGGGGEELQRRNDDEATEAEIPLAAAGNGPSPAAGVTS